MNEETKTYLWDKGTGVIEHYARLHEANWLSDYFRCTIEHDVDLEMWDLDLSEWNSESSFSYLNPKVVSVFYGVNLGLGRGMGYDYFIRGAATLANIVNPSQLPSLTVWLEAQHVAMYEAETFPAVNEKFLQDYVDILTTTLLQEESTTWRPFLSFISGIYWLLSQVRVEADHPIVLEIRELLLDRARKGLIEVF